MQDLRAALPLSSLPADLPNNLNLFYARCSSFHVKDLDLATSPQNIRLGGEIQFTWAQDKLFIVIPPIYIKTNHALLEKGINVTRIPGKQLPCANRLSYTLDAVQSFAQEHGFKQVFVAWIPASTPLATILRDRGQVIVSRSEMTPIAGKPTYSVVEIAK